MLSYLFGALAHLQQLVPRAAAQQLVMQLQHLAHGDGVHLGILSAGVSLGSSLLFTLLQGSWAQVAAAVLVLIMKHVSKLPVTSAMSGLQF